MGVDADGHFAVVFGVAIPRPKLLVASQDTKGKAKVAGQEDEDTATVKKRAKKDTSGRAKVTQDEDDKYEDEGRSQQAFNVAHEKVFGSNAETGLSLAIFEGSERRWHYDFEKVYVIEYKPSRVLYETVPSGCAVTVSLANMVAPSAQVTSDINKLLKDGLEIEEECEPGWVAVATCTCG